MSVLSLTGSRILENPFLFFFLNYLLVRPIFPNFFFFDFSSKELIGREDQGGKIKTYKQDHPSEEIHHGL